MDIFDQIAAGMSPPHSHSAHAPADLWRKETELQLSYALAKQVPDMARGFSIHTGYGENVALLVQRLVFLLGRTQAHSGNGYHDGTGQTQAGDHADGAEG